MDGGVLTSRTPGGGCAVRAAAARGDAVGHWTAQRAGLAALRPLGCPQGMQAEVGWPLPGRVWPICCWREGHCCRGRHHHCEPAHGHLRVVGCAAAVWPGGCPPPKACLCCQSQSRKDTSCQIPGRLCSTTFLSSQVIATACKWY